MSEAPLSPPWFEGGRPVLITGGRGFLGSHIALRLAASAPPGAEVIAVDNHHRDCFAPLGVPAPANLRFVTGDIRRPGSWISAFDSPSVVVHCAALAGVSTYYKAPADVLEVNGLGTARLLEALLPNPPALFINLSTSEVYGRDAAGADEAGPTPVGPVSDPRWTYAASKIFAEHLVLAYSKMGRLNAVSLRPFNVYGPGQMGEGAIRNFSEAAVRGLPLKVTGDGSPTRSWIYVDDFVDAVFALAATPSAWGRSFNVGNSSTSVSTRALAEAVLAAAESSAGIEFVPHPGTDVRTRWPRTEELREATGWQARVPLEEGLKRTVGFWEEQTRD
jgi:nucleoside-diphosphate-sugar epimerase